MVIPAILGIALLRVFTTIFSHQDYGHYNLALSTIGLIKVFSVIWLSSSTVRFYIKFDKDGKKDHFLSTLFIATLSSALLSALCAFGILVFAFKNALDIDQIVVLKVAIFASIAVTFFEVYIVIFRASLQAKKYSFYWLLYVIGKPIIGIALIFIFGLKAEGIFWGFLFAPLFLLFFIFRELQIIPHFRFKFISKEITVKLAKYGAPIALSNLAFWVLSLSDRYLIEYFKDSSQVGLYGVGYAIPEKTLQFTFMTLMLAAYPIIVNHWEKRGSESAQELISEMSRYYLILITPIFLALITLPKEILLIFASENFANGSIVIPFIAGGLYILGLSQYVQKGLELKQKSIKIAITALVAGATNISLNLVFIPRLGYYGAGVSCLAAYIVYLILSIVLVRKELAWKIPYSSVLKILVAAMSMIITVKFSTRFFDQFIIKTFFSLLCGFVVYSAVLLASREVKDVEMRYILSFIKKRAS